MDGALRAVHSADMVDERVCVIGAGAAGLGAMEVLQRHGIAFDCFEQSERVGGHWHTDYESLHLITSRDLSGFAGYPMPSNYPVYPSRDQMRDYLEGFATETGVRAHVRFGVRVERITPIGPPAATAGSVETSDGESREYTGVLVCNGHLWDQNLPTYPGEFTGRQIHSGAYRSIDDIEGTRVLTVGAGNSGCDLAVDAANARLESTISIRRGQMFQPKAVFGRPRAELKWLAKLPVRLNERIARAMSDVVIGPTRRATAACPSRRRATSTSSRRWSTTCCRTGSSTAGSTSSRAIERLDGKHRALRRRHEPRVRHDPVGDRLQGHAAVPGRGADPLARRRAAAHRRADAPGGRGEPVLRRPRRAARPAAAGLLRADRARRADARARPGPPLARWPRTSPRSTCPDARIDIVRAVWNRQMRGRAQGAGRGRR